ncbi:MAG: acetyl-CoA acetyltransferase [Deltaproteobacteria bacterium]|jgi:acetyl-CoA C-acetyltransferase|nr:acetyl-CoA acetyltransferase [Deltaproteobacteria bacterium]
MDPRTPLLVGLGAVSQREEDPARAREPLDLMGDAILAAGEDAGSRELLARAGWIACPRGFWDYGDPGRALAERIGASGARSLLGEIGVLQTTLFGRVGEHIARGRADVCIVTGGEAKYRNLRAQITGSGASLRPAPGEPEEVLRPREDIFHPQEIRHGLVLPVKQYAMVENALRIADGQSLDAHRDEVAALWAGMSEVAAKNESAWSREVLSPEAIRDPVGGNRMLAFPYTKLHNSQWNVDQAAALIFCAAGTADALGVPADRRVVLRAVSDSNFMLPLCEREALHRCAGFAAAGRSALACAGLRADQVNHRELYSCFPSAVRAQQRELEVPRELPVTVTGGMAFAGGPLNNFVLQAAVKMAQVLRSDPGSVGMVNAVSGVLTKQGVSLWSTEPGSPFGFADVSAEADANTARCELRSDAAGEARVISSTVEFDAEGASRAIALAELEPGIRALATSDDRELARAMTERDFSSEPITLDGEGSFRR